MSDDLALAIAIDTLQIHPNPERVEAAQILQRLREVTAPTAPVDVPARFRTAAEVAGERGWQELAAELGEISSYTDGQLEAVWRALTEDGGQDR